MCKTILLYCSSNLFIYDFCIKFNTFQCMTLIKSISGIRGTIGGFPGENLTPVDIIAFSSAFGQWIIEKQPQANRTIVIGRDARISGSMVNGLISNTLVAMGFTVIDIGLATTPTVEIAVPAENAAGGIIITASHNPKQWNALKLLNNKGEFVSASDGEHILKIAEKSAFAYNTIESIGNHIYNNTYTQKHIDAIVALPLVNKKAITNAQFTIAIDCVNSVGGIVIPQLLEALGVKTVIPLYCEPNGIFPHNPEPLPEHLTEIAQTVVANKADVGFVVDPDVDRLAIINEDGSMFGEEYTLVAIADYVLHHTPGNTVSNMSSTRALRDITEQKGYSYTASAVGEVNVVTTMKETHAVIGGEGNGGVIYPPLHYGRDALVGIALFLSHLATCGKSCKELRNTYPNYSISKNKIELTPNINVDTILEKIAQTYSREHVNTIDGVKIDFADSWVHLRKSNTEPIIRIYAEATTDIRANELANQIIKDIKSII